MPVVHAPKAPVAIDEYFRVARVNGISFSFDEKQVATMSDESGRPEVWVKPVAGGPGTHVNGFVHSFAFSPTQDSLAFEADNGGDELPHLYLTNGKGEAPLDIVADLPAGRRTRFVRWSPDGRRLLFLSSRRDEKLLDLVEYDIQSKKETVVWKAEGALAFVATTADFQRFALLETHSDANTDVYVVERKIADEHVLLTKHTGDVLYEPQSFSRDGKSLLLTSDEGGESTAALSLDIATQKSKPILKENWDVEFVGVSESGKYSFTISNADGTPKVALTETATHKVAALPLAPLGAAWALFDNTRSGAYLMGFSKRDRYLGAMLRSDTSPAAPFVLDLKEGKAIRMSDPLPASLKDRVMVSGSSVRIPSFDGKEVPAYV